MKNNIVTEIPPSKEDELMNRIYKFLVKNNDKGFTAEEIACQVLNESFISGNEYLEIKSCLNLCSDPDIKDITHLIEAFVEIDESDIESKMIDTESGERKFYKYEGESSDTKLFF